MEIGSPAWRKLIREGGRAQGISITQEQMALLTGHASELLRWNRKTNLTAITKPEDLAVKHILDSMAAVPELPLRASLLDIGSGGGFPGIVLKVLRPDITITLIDAARKKVSFLSHLIRVLRLSDADALHIRAEALAEESRYKQTFDAIVCRALCDLYTFVGMAMPLIDLQGAIMAYKGRRIETETELTRFSRPAAEIFPHAGILVNDRILSVALKTYPLFNSDAERTLVVFRPVT